ncbi:MAG: hypothetical protein JNN07_02320 [Verrucomicrobiales bacterium]|nr:hypothetical protein [Verrucomicrobiales bacterium]
MKHSIHLGTLSIALGLIPLNVSAGTFSFTNIRTDEDTLIDASKTYTHLIDFGSDAEAATINGVQFTSKGLTGPNYTLIGPGGNFVNNGEGSYAGTGLGDLFTDFFYAGAADGIQTLTLTGLREAHTYRLTFFVSGWGTPAVDITASDAPGVSTRIARDGTRWVPDPENPDFYESTGAGSPGAAISYDYVASADGTLVMIMNALSDGDTFHHYGLVNELVGTPDDADGDGIPDIYEAANGLNSSVNDSALDLDNDGLSNLAEYIALTKANNPDTDEDGLKDGVETNTGTFVSATNTGTNPVKADTDGDGLNDGAETNTGTFVNATNTGSNPLLADTDSDAFDDGAEVAGGFNPTLATSTPESATSIRTAVEFRFNAGKGISYRIEGSANLQDWTTIEATINGNGGTVTRFYSTENQPLRFYRAKRN